MTTVEINGVKLDVDLTTARQITAYKIGDTVKVLIKSYSDYKVCYGVIVGFDPFQALPTIIIAYLNSDYGDTNLKFLYYNSASKDTEICPCIQAEYLGLEKQNVLDKMDSEIAKKEAEIKEIKLKRQYFLSRFDKYFTDCVKVKDGMVNAADQQ